MAASTHIIILHLRAGYQYLNLSRNRVGSVAVGNDQCISLFDRLLIDRSFSVCNAQDLERLVLLKTLSCLDTVSDDFVVIRAITLFGDFGIDPLFAPVGNPDDIQGFLNV